MTGTAGYATGNGSGTPEALTLNAQPGRFIRRRRCVVPRPTGIVTIDHLKARRVVVERQGIKLAILTGTDKRCPSAWLTCEPRESDRTLAG